MLYQAQNPFLFPLSAFTPSLPPPPPPPSYTSDPVGAAAALPSSVQKMECLEGALVTGRTEDFLVNNGQNDAIGEDSFVDNLLLDGEDGLLEGETGNKSGEEADERNHGSLSVAAVQESVQEREQGKDSGLSTVDDFGADQAEDLADLEWLSHFVEDSFSGNSLTWPDGKLPEKPTGDESHHAVKTPVQANPRAPTPTQTKARSKRARTGGRVWSLGGSSSLNESSSSSTSSSSTLSDTWLIFGRPSQNSESLLGQQLLPAAAQKQRKRKGMRTSVSGGGGTGQPRRCSHCGVQKTPQWRTGPNGSKTLCNACGVRFKSGRLFPEYRPACSPSFSSEIHSNHHRKVLEMRRKKEAEVGPPPVQTF